MKNKYRKIEFSAGESIESAINELKGHVDLVCGSFNGQMLYSDVDNIDSAFKKITGKTKAEFYNSFSELTNVVKDNEFYKNKNVEGYLFNTEAEAEFIEHFFQYVKAKKTFSRTIDLFKILNTLIGNDSEWKY